MRLLLDAHLHSAVYLTTLHFKARSQCVIATFDASNALDHKATPLETAAKQLGARCPSLRSFPLRSRRGPGHPATRRTERSRGRAMMDVATAASRGQERPAQLLTSEVCSTRIDVVSAEGSPQFHAHPRGGTPACVLEAVLLRAVRGVGGSPLREDLFGIFEVTPSVIYGANMHVS